MTGEAVARYAQQRDLALPFSTQDASPDAIDAPRQTLSEMFALRRMLRPSQQRTEVAPHAGLGLQQYAQVAARCGAMAICLPTNSSAPTCATMSL